MTDDLAVSVIIVLPTIALHWSAWCTWDSLLLDARMIAVATKVPNSPGVYEVRSVDSEERLTIGKASNLRMRIKQGLVKGKTPHSSGKRFREIEDTSRLLVRWSVTERPAAVEEELHRQYREKYGRLPKYTKRT